ncbi:Telomerase protein component 1 [Saxophila tyrrhenica]|uniref:phosphatidylinositol-3,4,5-trisphosphate 3-phosphatase n=1 Tax=Saxophila tyrrhenica TaxID=1690608 RepID=A0AAV9PU84_9PEZI|nr:Telomerase protein component 1 [Saxophila tyrrhenica]
MASILRQIVAGPRAQHAESNLDLCYVTPYLIATSGPGATYPQVAYRNPLKDLVKFLDSKHRSQWAIWEFRAEGTGYPDSEVYNRVWHYPWPDHHPPPFALIPLIMGSMRQWLKDEQEEGRVVVVHCKAGKGRSGTVCCSYLISEEGWTGEEAMQRFTETRMRPGFGVGISIPSQRRYIGYVERWTKGGKMYVERAVEVVEVHVWGLRDGVKIAVEGYVEEGKKIKKFHTFHSHEREIVRGSAAKETGLADVAFEVLGRKKSVKHKQSSAATVEQDPEIKKALNGADEKVNEKRDEEQPIGADVIFRPSSRVVLPSSDINIDLERRNKASLGGFTMVTSVAHVWFNTFFEGNGPEQGGSPDDSGVFEIDFDAMDGLKGSSRKGTRAFDKMAVVWKAVDVGRKPEVVITEPAEGEEVKQAEPADWRGEKPTLLKKKLGLRPAETDSGSVSRASSVRSQQSETAYDSGDELNGVRSDVNGVDAAESSPLRESSPPGNEDTGTQVPTPNPPEKSHTDPLPISQADGAADLQSGTKHVSTSDLPEGLPADEMKDAKEHRIGEMVRKQTK